MGSTNSTKTSKFSAVKALAKSMLGGKSSAKSAQAAKKSAGPAKSVKAAGKSESKKAAPAKANVKSNGKANVKAAAKAPLKAAPKGKTLPTKAEVKAELKATAKGKAAPVPAALPKVAEKLTVKAAKGKKLGGRTSSRNYALDAESVCREVACEGLSTTAGYCRLHYIKNWKKIKRKELILKEGKLNQYIEELVAKYPDKYIEAIRQDLAGDKDFAKVIYDLDLDESVDDFDIDGESAEAIIDTIKRDFDDEGEGGF